MLTFTSLSDIPRDFGPSVVTIGKFDGVHSGHRAVLGRLLEVAKDLGFAPVVVTFDRNPLSLLAPEKCPVPLLSNAQKLEALAAVGVDATLMLEFDHALSALAPEAFVEQVLVGGLRASAVLVGADFHFGARGAGDVALLRQLGAQRGFEVIVVDDVAPDGQRRASSTWIRELLSEGRVVEASALLGALPGIRSTVVRGVQRGRALGYPTANLSPDIEGYVPADGVYAAWLTADGIRYPAAVSIGNNPTFDGVPDKQVEAHVIDHTLDLYGRVVELSFVEFVRGMRAFPNADALVEQMGVDERWIRDILSAAT
ncbi:MAG: bifunctional riboflavin kinase/FAD synthetase [Rhodoglobus sp.]